MEIFIVRHTTPDIDKGICYGQSDVSLAVTFPEEAKQVLRQLPKKPIVVYSSPSKRCVALAQQIPYQNMVQSADLMEMNFGDWELKPWSDIPKETLNPWMEDFVNYKVPDGESMRILADRVNHWFEHLHTTNDETVVIVTHAGPIRVLLSAIHQTPLEEAFERYQVAYGEVFIVSEDAQQ
ncbi:MAG: alpha-ribazole phosphatase [Bacteroidota bacterium]